MKERYFWHWSLNRISNESPYHMSKKAHMTLYENNLYRRFYGKLDWKKQNPFVKEMENIDDIEICHCGQSSFYVQYSHLSSNVSLSIETSFDFGNVSLRIFSLLAWNQWHWSRKNENRGQYWFLASASYHDFLHFSSFPSYLDASRNVFQKDQHSLCWQSLEASICCTYAVSWCLSCINWKPTSTCDNSSEKHLLWWSEPPKGTRWSCQQCSILTSIGCCSKYLEFCNENKIYHLHAF